MNEKELKQRTKQFALRVIKLVGGASEIDRRTGNRQPTRPFWNFSWREL